MARQRPKDERLTRNTSEEFIDVMTGKKKTVGAWNAEMKADRDRRRGTSGVYNPMTGEREYGGQRRGPRKDMQGRRYGR